MGRILAGAALGASFAALVFVAAGFAHSARTTSATSRAAVTPAQFNALKTRVAKLEKATGALTSYTVNCLFKYVGVARYGTPPNGGYVYDTDNNPANGQALTTALDVTDTGETPSFYVPATTNTQCLSSGTLRLDLGIRQSGLMSSRGFTRVLIVRSASYGSK